MNHEAHESAGGGESSPLFESVLAAVLRLDIHNSTPVVSKDQQAFLDFIEKLLKEVDSDAYPSLIVKTDEGDAVRAAFANARDALRCAFRLRHAAQQPVEISDDTIIFMEPRVVLHFDEFEKTEDNRVKGLGQVLVQRLDHAPPPGEIWASEAFADTARHTRADKGYSFEYVGQRELDKGAGTHPCYSVALASAGAARHGSQRPYDPVQIATQLLDRGDLSSQASAVEVLRTIESQRSSDKLTEIALDSKFDRRIRLAALNGLKGLGDYIDIERVTNVYNNEKADTEIRAQLLLVLGATGSESITDTLINLVTKKSQPEHTRIREAALFAMRSLRASLTAECVEAALADPEIEVRKAACVAAAGSSHMPGTVREKLRKITLDAESPEGLRNVACEALSAQEATSTLITMLAEVAQRYDLSPTLRSYAIEGLAQSDDPAALRAVEEVARRTNDSLQVDANAMLLEMYAPGRRARRRAKRPESDIAEVIRLRTRPLQDGPDEAA